ncbi:MAG: hypothetical protein Q8873_05250 [Bacillota bacterium]|nr:hypothetical protein [Bacillota bacterium]
MLSNNDYYILTPEDVMEELCIGRNEKIPRKELNVFIDKSIRN